MELESDRENDNSHEEINQERKKNYDESDKNKQKNQQKNKPSEIERTESSKSILPARNRAPPARYGVYRAYLIAIEKLNEKDLTYDKTLRNGWKDAINNEIDNIFKKSDMGIYRRQRATPHRCRMEVQDRNKSRKTENPEKQKARLIARGCRSENESIYAHTDSITVKFLIIFLIIVNK